MADDARQIKITYRGQTLVKGPLDFFELKAGASPGFGFFRCGPDEHAAVSSASPGYGDLVLIDGSRTLTFTNIYFVKSTFDELSGCYDIVLADYRWTWENSYVENDYNTYASQEIDGSEYELEDKNGGSNWTYVTLIDDVIGSTPTLPRTITRQPRNIRGIGRNVVEVLQQCMFDLNAFLAYNPFAHTLAIKKLGDIDSADTTTMNGFSAHVSQARTITPGILWKPATVKAFYATDAGNFAAKTAAVSGGTGEKGYITSYSDSTNGQAYTQEFATELATAMAGAPSWAEAVYNGWHQITLNTQCHYIRWQLTPFGAFTTIKRVFPQAIQPQIASSVFAANGYKMGMGGGSGLPDAGEQYTGLYANPAGVWTIDWLRLHSI